MNRSALTALALLLAACGGPDDPAQTRKAAGRGTGDIVIGAAWPWEAYKSVLYWQGMELALDELNAAGGVLGRKLRVERADDHESIDEGRTVAQRFGKNPEVVAVIGHLHSYVSVPAAAIYDLSGVVMLAPTSTTPELTNKGYRRVFRTIFSDDEVGRQMAEFARGRGYRRVAIYYARNEYGRGLANAFEETLSAGGGTIADRQSYDPGSTGNRRSAEQTVSAWTSLEFDAVFIAGQDEQGALLASEMRRQGIRAPILGSDALATPGYTGTGGDATEGTVIAAAFHPDAPMPEVRAFTERFQKRFGTRPDVGAALGYDAVRVLADAIRRAGTSDPEDIANALRGTRGWPGVTGAFSFDSAGNLVNMPIRKVVVRNGRFEFLDDGTAVAAR